MSEDDFSPKYTLLHTGGEAKGGVSEVAKVQGFAMAVRRVPPLSSRTSGNIQNTLVTLNPLYPGDAHCGLACDLEHTLPEVEALHPHAAALGFPSQDRNPSFPRHQCTNYFLQHSGLHSGQDNILTQRSSGSRQPGCGCDELQGRIGSILSSY